MAYGHCANCAGLLYGDETECRICKAPVGAPPPPPPTPIDRWQAPAPSSWSAEPPSAPPAATTPPAPPGPAAPSAPPPPAAGFGTESRPEPSAPSWAVPDGAVPSPSASGPAAGAPGPTWAVPDDGAAAPTWAVPGTAPAGPASVPPPPPPPPPPPAAGTGAPGDFGSAASGPTYTPPTWAPTDRGGPGFGSGPAAANPPPPYAPPGSGPLGQAPSSYAPPNQVPPSYAPPSYAPPTSGPPGTATGSYAPPSFAPPAQGPPGAGPGGYGPPPAWPPGGGATPGWGAPGWGTPGWSAPPPPARKRTGLTIVISVATLLVVLVASVGAVTLLGRTDKGPEHPEAWDSRVQFAVSFIESHRGKPFDHPVFIDFVPESEFKQDVGSTDEVTQEERDEAADQVAVLRAFGLVRGDPNLIDESAALQSGGTLAYYDPRSKRVRVRGTELDLATKSTVVHELTHAWQDQHTDLGRLERMTNSQERDAFRAVVEGDAENTADAWVASLPQADQDKFHEEMEATTDKATEEMSNVPSVLLAAMGAPYQIGPAFMQGMTADGGQARALKVLRRPPTNERQLIQPWLYDRGKGDYDEVELPGADEDDPDVIDSGSFGVLFTYLVLAEQLDPHVAMAATDVLSGDGYRTTKTDGKVCVTARFTSDDHQDAALIDAFTDWAATMPSATVRPGTDEVDVEACDPGAATGEAPAKDEPGSERALTVIQFPMVRVVFWGQVLDADGTAAEAECFATTATSLLTIQDLSATPETSRVQAIGLEARRRCE